MVIFGTTEERPIKVVFDFPYSKSDIVYADETGDPYKVLSCVKFGTGLNLTRLERQISRTEKIMMINHFKFLRKYNLVL